MPGPELLPLFIEPLNRARLRYMVTGSLAAVAYGEPRLTLDVDLVLDLGLEALSRLVEAFPLPVFYCPPVEVLRVECNRAQRGHFNLLHPETGFKADVYLVGQDPLHTWALARRRAFDIEGLSIWFAPPEYVIVRKLQYFQEGGSEKHMHDIRGILRCSPQALDLTWLEAIVRAQGLESYWSQCQSV